jgi:hypothetical protein
MCEGQSITRAGMSMSTAYLLRVIISSIYHIHLSSHANTTDSFKATEVASPSHNDYAVTATLGFTPIPL